MSPRGLTLTELRHMYPHLFYRGQDWFVREHFMAMLPSEPPAKGPIRIVGRGKVPKKGTKLPRAVDLATIYVNNPSDPVFQDYVWTGDFDALGQRVFVGGCANGKGFEVHRFLHITERFQTPEAA